MTLPHTPLHIAQGTLTRCQHANIVALLQGTASAKCLAATIWDDRILLAKAFPHLENCCTPELCRHNSYLSASIHTHTISMLILWYFPRHSIYQVLCSHLSASQTIACMNILFQHPLDTAPHHVCTAQGTLTRCQHANIMILFQGTASAKCQPGTILHYRILHA